MNYPDRPLIARQSVSRRAANREAVVDVVAATLFRPSPRPSTVAQLAATAVRGQDHATAHIRPTSPLKSRGTSRSAQLIRRDHTVLYCLAPRDAWYRVTVSQYAHLVRGRTTY